MFLLCQLGLCLGLCFSYGQVLKQASRQGQSYSNGVQRLPGSGLVARPCISISGASSARQETSFEDQLSLERRCSGNQQVCYLDFERKSDRCSSPPPLLRRAFSNASGGPSELKLVLYGAQWGQEAGSAPDPPLGKLLGPFAGEGSSLLNMDSLELKVKIKERTLECMRCRLAQSWHTQASDSLASASSKGKHGIAGQTRSFCA
jgi:hypothetical protein